MRYARSGVGALILLSFLLWPSSAPEGPQSSPACLAEGWPGSGYWYAPRAVSQSPDGLCAQTLYITEDRYVALTVCGAPQTRVLYPGWRRWPDIYAPDALLGGIVGLEVWRVTLTAEERCQVLEAQGPRLWPADAVPDLFEQPIPPYRAPGYYLPIIRH